MNQIFFHYFFPKLPLSCSDRQKLDYGWKRNEIFSHGTWKMEYFVNVYNGLFVSEATVEHL